MITERRYFRKRINYAVALASEAARPLLRSVVRADGASPPTSWRRGLLVGADHIGDVLYNTASLPYLRRGLPNCEWSYVASAPASEVLVTNPHVAEVITPRNRAEWVRNVSEKAFDVIVCYNSSSYWRDLILAWRLGISNRVGYVHKGFSGLVTYPIRISHPQPYPAYFRALVSQLTGEPPVWDLRPEVLTGADDDTAAQDVWGSLRLSSGRPTLACFVTSRQPTGIWPIEFFAETISRLVAMGVQVVLCGSRTDEAALEELRRRFGLSCSIMAGKLSLRPLVAFLSRCSAVLCPDSGPRHLGNAAGVPVFFFRNLWSSKVETGAYCDSEVDLAPDIEFLSQKAQHEYLVKVTPARVLDALTPVLLQTRTTGAPTTPQ